MVNTSLDEPQAGEFDPMGWNWIHVTVVNADGTSGGDAWHRLRVD
jgi:hypothetical protein